MNTQGRGPRCPAGRRGERRSGGGGGSRIGTGVVAASTGATGASIKRAAGIWARVGGRAAGRPLNPSPLTTPSCDDRPSSSRARRASSTRSPRWGKICPASSPATTSSASSRPSRRCPRIRVPLSLCIYRGEKITTRAALSIKSDLKHLFQKTKKPSPAQPRSSSAPSPTGSPAAPLPPTRPRRSTAPSKCCSRRWPTRSRTGSPSRSSPSRCDELATD